MRIVYVLTTLGIGGAEKQVIALGERMSVKGHTVALLVLKHAAGEEWPTKLPVMRLNMLKTSASILHGIRFSAGFLRVFKPDIVHSHTFPANIFSRLLRAWGIRCLHVNTIHNIFEGGWHRMMLYWATDVFVDRVTAVSRSAMDRFRRERAVSARKLSVLTNGIDTEEFVPDKSRRRRIRRNLDLREVFVWLAVGRVVPAKDYPNLLEAFALVREALPETKLWIVGEGYLAGNDFSDSEVMKLAHAPERAVEFLGLRRDVPALLDAADGFVLSSAWEGMPLALGEAMAMEKPVVATDVGGVRELVGEAGLIVAARNSRALTDAMLQVMAMSGSDRAGLGSRARDRIQRCFSMDAKAVEWEECYTRWMREKSG